MDERLRFVVRLLDGENGLSPGFRACLQELYEELVHVDERMARADEQARRLITILGVGPMTATALLAAVGDISTFRNGRELAAWLGLVPRQCSTGGPQAGSTQSMVEAVDEPTSQERRHGSAGQPDGTHGLGAAGAPGSVPKRLCAGPLIERPIPIRLM